MTLFHPTLTSAKGSDEPLLSAASRPDAFSRRMRSTPSSDDRPSSEASATGGGGGLSLIHETVKLTTPCVESCCFGNLSVDRFLSASRSTVTSPSPSLHLMGSLSKSATFSEPHSSPNVPRSSRSSFHFGSRLCSITELVTLFHPTLTSAKGSDEPLLSAASRPDAFSRRMRSTPTCRSRSLSASDDCGSHPNTFLKEEPNICRAAHEQTRTLSE